MMDVAAHLVEKADALIVALGQLSVAQERGAALTEVEALTQRVIEAESDLVATRQAAGVAVAAR